MNNFPRFSVYDRYGDRFRIEPNTSVHGKLLVTSCVHKTEMSQNDARRLHAWLTDYLRQVE